MPKRKPKFKPKFKRPPNSYSTEEINELRRKTEAAGMRIVWIDSRKPFLVFNSEEWRMMDEIELMDAIVTRLMDKAS